MAFDLEDPSTWPPVEGRLEYVDGRLLYMPPCGEEQSILVANVAWVLVDWARARPEFDVGTNEAGMKLGPDARGADAAVWRRDPKARRQKRFWRMAPLLAVEVVGGDESDDEGALRDKAKWYFRHGTKIVWIVAPDTREVVVLRERQEQRYRSGETIPAELELPGLEVEVSHIFAKLGSAN
jgi:Uma2 family endonuclease